MAVDRFGILGKVILRTYQIESVVAEGGFGVIYQAYHRGFRAQVALKCLKIPSELDDRARAQFLEQFRSEAEVLFRLSATIPTIVRPLHVDAFQTDQHELVPFLALEWLEGKTLDAAISERAASGKPPLDLPSSLRLLQPVASALMAAHDFPGPDGQRRCVIHRDLKPENLFIAKQGDEYVTKVLDFGISKVTSTGRTVSLTSPVGELIAFSPAYAAPEQWSPQRFGASGPWTDVWGLTVTLLEAISGRLIFPGDPTQALEAILNVQNRPTPRALGVWVHDTTERVFARALAIEPRDRYQSVRDFWSELNRSVTTNTADGAPRSLSERSKTKMEHAARLPSPAAVARPALAPKGSLRLEVNPVSVRPPALPPRPKPHTPSLLKTLTPALLLVALSIALTLVDRVFVLSRGIPLSLGPIRTSWIAGGVMVVAIATGVSALRRSYD